LSNKESWVRISLKDGTSALLPFSKWERYTDAQFKDLDTGNYSRLIHVKDDIQHFNIVDSWDVYEDIEDIIDDISDELDFFCEE